MKLLTFKLPQEMSITKRKTMFNDDEFEDNRLIALKCRVFLGVSALLGTAPFAVNKMIEPLTEVEQNTLIMAGQSLVLVILTIIAASLGYKAIEGKIKGVYNQLAMRFGALVALHGTSQFFVFFYGLKLHSEYPNYIAAILQILIVVFGAKKLLSTTK